MNSKRAMAQLLNYLAGVGVTHVPKVQLPKPAPLSGRSAGVSRSSTSPSPISSAATVSAGGRPLPALPVSSPAPRPASSEPGVDTVRPFHLLNLPAAPEGQSVVVPEKNPLTASLLNSRFVTDTEKADSLCQLAGVVARCTRCQELAGARKQTVFGVGNPNARIMLIGEAPGADEDATGEPFVGRAGQLLNRILEASQLKREDLYICNILRCRPPGNRNPLPQEAANCREFLEAQIHIVKPEYIICLGTIAAQNLLNDKRPVGKLRGQFMDYQGARVLCTYHPSYLLRNPSAKALVWDDMKFFMQELGISLT